ncbi:MAG: glycosyltransferase family 9 protein [Nitrospirae bacterium]|nr:glycosyltransferase family 9 protein [Nitrospirota bacterium]
MIYVLLTYIFYPVLYLVTLLRCRHFGRSNLKRRDSSLTLGMTSSEQKLKKILVIQTAKIGDLICLTPVFREIKKKYPDIHLAVMANPAAKELLEHNPYVNEVITINNHEYKGFSGKIKLSNLIRKENYDIAICLNPNVPFAIATLWGLVPVRLSIMPDFSGITFKMASIFYTFLERYIRGKLVMETYMQMLKKIGIESNNRTKEVYKSPDADKKAEKFLSEFSGKDIPLIGIAVGSGNKLKELGAEKLAVLADRMIEELQARVILIGSDNEKDTAVKILSLSKNKNAIIDSTGMFTLSELPALIEKLFLFIGVDTGITYMADALLVPLIDIAGPSDMSDQRPLGKNSIIIQKDFPCVPCSHAFNAPYSCERGDRICITSVDVSEIVEAAKKLFEP